MKRWIKKNQLLLYLFLTYLIACIATILHNVFGIHFISQSNLTFPAVILWVFYIFSPTISGFLITTFVEGKKGILNVIRGYTIVKVNWFWYFGALILLLAPLSIGFIFFILEKSPGPSDSISVGNIFYLIGFGLLSGPISEEGGWRGFMLPKLESKHNASVSSLILGFTWYVWHIPLYFIEGTSQYESLQYGIVSSIVSISIYWVLVMVIAQILTFLYNNSRGSLIITILAHFCFNFSSTLILNSGLGLLEPMTFNIVGSILAIAYLVLIYAGFGYQNMSRKDKDKLPFNRS
ncbi:MAG: CPBP family intramembrane metalloprotease [Candidatus Lokiarchaeota archaeon]|nr:CPBP family intramembrane metalloprotease [Candidatus Lokiarchaeota archaeon]